MKAKIRFLAKKILNHQNKKTNTYALDQRINQALFKHIKQLRSRNILLYYPMKHEVNLLPLIDQLKKQKLNVLIPCIRGSEMQIGSFRFPLKNGKYGIKESACSKPYNGKIDVAIVPILGFDLAYRRIGFGMGYYDRFFATKLHKPYIIFTSRTLIFSKQMITNEYDIKADMIVGGRILRIDNGNF